MKLLCFGFENRCDFLINLCKMHDEIAKFKHQYACGDIEDDMLFDKQHRGKNAEREDAHRDLISDRELAF